MTYWMPDQVRHDGIELTEQQCYWSCGYSEFNGDCGNYI